VEHGWDAGLRPQPRAPSAHSLSPPPGRAGARRRKLWERGGGGLGDELWVAPDGGATRSLGAVGGGGGVGGEGERERESGWQRRWDGEDSVPARTRHPPPRGLPAGAGDEARGGVLASLPLKEEGGPRLNDMWALLKCDSKDN
jgi:hypothetical protein